MWLLGSFPEIMSWHLTDHDGERHGAVTSRWWARTADSLVNRQLPRQTGGCSSVVLDNDTDCESGERHCHRQPKGSFHGSSAVRRRRRGRRFTYHTCSTPSSRRWRCRRHREGWFMDTKLYFPWNWHFDFPVEKYCLLELIQHYQIVPRPKKFTVRLLGKV